MKSLVIKICDILIIILLLALVLTLLTSCTSRSSQITERKSKTIIQSISTNEGVNVEPYIKVIGYIDDRYISRVAVIEIEGKRYIVQASGGILEITNNNRIKEN